jgi:hypothetical protein
MEHLDRALSDFETQVRAGRANVRVVHKDGSGGAGAFSAPWLLILPVFAAARARRAAHGRGAR